MVVLGNIFLSADKIITFPHLALDVIGILGIIISIDCAVKSSRNHKKDRIQKLREAFVEFCYIVSIVVSLVFSNPIILGCNVGLVVLATWIMFFNERRQSKLIQQQMAHITIKHIRKFEKLLDTNPIVATIFKELLSKSPYKHLEDIPMEELNQMVLASIAISKSKAVRQDAQLAKLSKLVKTHPAIKEEFLKATKGMKNKADWANLNVSEIINSGLKAEKD